jgi:hypothetical protein
MGICPSINREVYMGDFPNFSLSVKSKISGDSEKCLFDYQYNNDEEASEQKIRYVHALKISTVWYL